LFLGLQAFALSRLSVNGFLFFLYPKSSQNATDVALSICAASWQLLTAAALAGRLEAMGAAFHRCLACDCLFDDQQTHNRDKRQPLIQHEMRPPAARAKAMPASFNDSGYSLSNSGSGYSREPRDRKAMLQTSMHKPMLHTTYRPSEAYLEEQRQAAASGNQATGHYNHGQPAIPEDPMVSFCILRSWLDYSLRLLCVPPGK
jgi:hypothetical protein